MTNQNTKKNPLAGIPDVDFARPALFQMKQRGISEYDVYKNITAPTASVRKDTKSGNFVYRMGPYRVVAKRDPSEHVTVITFATSEETR
ncbi:hypothetical protein [Pararhizobium sp. O133]|uniref:hypothetical protein n=1 Tax=Pararhizobium sp. O133 TaxID=3449278 RepID=UPI003F686E09